LYYIAPDGQLMAVPVVADKSARIPAFGPAVALFRTNLVSAAATSVGVIAAGVKAQSAVAPDDRFLMVVPAADSATTTPIFIVINWPATLRR
jgi:hypothetical protein